MKRCTLIFLLLLTGLIASAQQLPYRDSLKRELAMAKEDTNKVILLFDLANSYDAFHSPDSVILFSQHAYTLATQLHHPEMINYSKVLMGGALWVMGDYLQADKYLTDAIKFYESQRNPRVMGLYADMGSSKRDHGEYREALYYSFKGDSLDNTFDTCRACGIFKMITGSIYVEMNKPDSALYYLRQGHPEWDYTMWLIGRAYEQKGNNTLADDYYHRSFSGLIKGYNLKDLANVCISLSQFFKKEGKKDSATYFAKTGYDAAAKGKYIKGVWQLGVELSDLYEHKDAGESLRYYKLAMAAKDKIVDVQKTTQLLNAQFNEQLQQQRAEAYKTNLQNKTRTIILLIALGFFLLIVVILYRNNQHKQKAKVQIEKAYDELKSTQAQLIQSEKMASLGQLTAGIAHEIQNPLNFVNNFSEINTELIEELEEEAGRGNINEVKIIAKDLKENEQKIIHHGRRAESIVKGMLQHSRASSGKRELTNLNTLVDESLRLSYHGLRAKDKEFNAAIYTDLDENIGNMSIVPQDISRVLLNLLNNAFYAVNEKRNTLNGAYEPAVSVCTKKMNGKAEIQVKDNGNGIPQNIIDKIFQPFFTTKPTGQGTGLGLSLSYDIIKAHGGNISVESKEGEGSEFIIQLPN